MGVSSVSNVSESMKICIFDLQRGHHEGEELDKILFFFPAELSFSTQLSVIGLSEGLITFTRIFSPEAACDVIEAERHTHVFYEAEPDIWMVMVVEKSKDYEIIGQIDALRQVLKEVHSLFYMFYGSIRLLLEKEPGGGLVRSRLYSFVMDYLNDFLVGKKLQLPSFRDCLKERGTVQMLTVGREAAIEVQSLVRIVESCVGSTHCHHLVMFQDLLVSSTLSPVDTVNIFSYAVSRLSPRVLSSGSSSWSYLLRGNSSSHAPFASSLPSTGSVSAQFHGSRETSPDGSENHHIGQLLSHGNWFRGKDGFLASHAWGSEAGEFAPTVWLHQTEEKMHLCVHQHKNFTFVILIPVTSILNEEQGISVMKQQILEKALLKILKVEEKLSKGWGGENAYHVSGYRYLLVDRDSIASRASPPGKVAKLTKESLIELSRLRDEVDVEKRRAGCEKDLEMCIRARNNAWIIARIVRGKELYMVLDKANETLLFASDAVEKFSDRYCDGTFSLD